LRALFLLPRLGSRDHRKLNLIGKASQMQGQSIEQFPLGRDSGKIANQPAFGCVRSELFERGLIVIYGHTSLLPVLPG
jgi:hypothetical protein